MATIRELREVEHLEGLSRLLDEVWSQHGGSIVTTAHLRALQQSGNYVVGAFEAGRLVGGSVAFLGRDRTKLFLHSHVTAVIADSQDKGVGRDLKLHQRDWCLERQLDEVRWTYDPLVRRNAVLNLNRLGAVVNGYLENHYGTMDDELNAGDPSDRFMVSWELHSERALAAINSPVRSKTTPEVLATRARWLVREEGGEPVIDPEISARMLCATPEDIVVMRRYAHDRALRWRIALREALTPLLTGGSHRVTGITSDGDYLIEA